MKTTPATPVYRDTTEKLLAEIYDIGDIRSLYFGGKYLQSRMSMSAPHLLLLPYTQYMMLSLLLLCKLQRVLLIGLGAGSLIRFIHHHFPECQIDAIDLSAQVIQLAKGYFQLPEDESIEIFCGDGHDFLLQKGHKNRYDLILVDAFNEQGIAADIYTENFFKLCKNALQQEGILSCNLWSGIPGEVERITCELGCRFPHILLTPVPRRGNLICLAQTKAIDWSLICRKRRELRKLQDQFHLDFRQMTKVALQNNLSIGQRLRHFFSW